MILKNLKERRIHAGLTQKELAALIPCSPSTVRKYEGGDVEVFRKWADKAALALGCKVKDLEGK